MCGLKFPPLSGHLVSPPPSGNAALHWLGVYEKWSGKKKCRGFHIPGLWQGFIALPEGVRGAATYHMYMEY